MAFEPKTWANGSGGGTPITASELNRIEAGIEEAHDLAGGAVTWASVTGKPTTFAPSAHTHTLSQITDAGDAAALNLGTAADTVAAGNHTHTPASIGAAAASHTHTLSQITDAGDAAALDLGTAAGTVSEGNHTHSNYVPTTRTVNAKPLSANVSLNGADVALTGYVIGTVELAAVAATDTLNAAIAKLEKRIADLEAI